MNKATWLAVVIGVLGGCTEVRGNEQAVMIQNAPVSLSSHLWINMMPTIGEVQDRALHGALYLESEQELPVEMDVKSVAIRQGDQSWVIQGDLLELRTHNQNKWEVAFIWQFEINPDAPVDVTLEVETNQRTDLLVERDIQVQFVY